MAESFGRIFDEELHLQSEVPIHKLPGVDMEQVKAPWPKIVPEEWDMAPSLLEIGGQCIFPIYGCSGGITASHIFYLAGIPKGWRGRGTIRCFSVEVEPSFDCSSEDLGAAVRAALKIAVERFMAGEGREINTSRCDLGRGDLIVRC